MSKYFRNFDHYGYEFPSVNSYEEAERLYENTTPLRGVRGPLDLRPIGRRRNGFSFIKKMDGAYRIWTTYSQSTWALKRNASVNPYDYSGSDVSVDFYKDEIVINMGNTNVESCAMLAACVNLVRYNAKLYIETSRGLFLLPKGETTLRKKSDGWQVANPVREKILKLSPATKKKITKELQDWFSWAKKMWPFVDVAVPASPTYSRRRWRLEELSKDVSLLKICKEESVEWGWDREVRKSIGRLLSFEEFKKKRWPQARKAKCLVANSQFANIPLGTPAPRQGF